MKLPPCNHRNERVDPPPGEAAALLSRGKSAEGEKSFEPWKLLEPREKRREREPAHRPDRAEHARNEPSVSGGASNFLTGGSPLRLPSAAPPSRSRGPRRGRPRAGSRSGRAPHSLRVRAAVRRGESRLTVLPSRTVRGAETMRAERA